MSTNSLSIMITDSKFSWRKRAMAFKYAWQGFKALLRYEHNARIHVVAAVVAVAVGFFLKISAGEWCAVVMCIAMVISAEALNSSLEALADKITTNHDPLIGRAKDLGATAVTLLALASVTVGLIIFLPKILCLFHTIL